MPVCLAKSKQSLVALPHLLQPKRYWRSPLCIPFVCTARELSGHLSNRLTTTLTLSSRPVCGDALLLLLNQPRVRTDINTHGCTKLRANRHEPSRISLRSGAVRTTRAKSDAVSDRLTKTESPRSRRAARRNGRFCLNNIAVYAPNKSFRRLNNIDATREPFRDC